MVTLEKGQRVIVRSNEEEPTKVGTFIGWGTLNGNSRFPLVEIDDKAYIIMGIVFPYHEGFLQFLNSIPPKEAWDLSHDISIINQEVHRKNQ